jgi:hypothetical protein
MTILGIKDVDPPINNWCSSGHIAPAMFKSDANSDATPTKFYSVSSAGMSGIFCELCMIVAQHLANQKRKGKI